MITPLPHTAPNTALSPQEQQALASDPAFSVWVTASAGSGKTTVLVGRILRLLLPSPDLSRPGVPPHRILAITYTRAAAAHMNNKIQERLSQWAVWDDTHLREDLARLINEEPSDDFISHARGLFADILEQAQGLQIHTIHAFCQSVLARFPLEANLSPGFDVMDESEASRLLRLSIHDVLSDTAQPCINDSLRILSPLLELEKLSDLISQVREQQDLLHEWVRESDTRLAVKSRLAQRFPPPKNYAALIDALSLRTILEPLRQDDKKSNTELAEKLAHALEDTNNPAYLDRLCAAVLTQGNTPRVLYGIAKKDEAISEQLTQLQALCTDYLNEKNLAIQIEHTSALLYIAYACNARYTALKKQRCVLDYEDLITKTHHLLHTVSVSWVHYKLDQGIDHILVDEAQDTSPAQWDIILRLMDDFFADTMQSRPFGPRSIFVVGDPKQSIYSFRGADPVRFLHLKNLLRDKIDHSSRQSPHITPWREVDFTRSFRTVPLILHLVDQCFTTQEQRVALGLAPTQALQHISHRKDDGGYIEILPPFLIPTPKKSASDSWVIALRDAQEEQTRISGTQSILNYARAVAAHIQTMLEKPAIIPALNRPVKPSDILILFETRTALTSAIIRALKEKNIPVSGIDRLMLTDHIAVQDMLAMLSFACLPHDDMALACVLKSPLVGWDDDQLFAVAHDRARHTSLWTQLQSVKPDLALWLADFITAADTLTPYAFLEKLLMTPPNASAYKSGLQALLARLGKDALDPIYELLNIALALEGSDIRTCRRFLNQLRRGRVEIKREMEEARDEVRIMTLHAAKGLESSVVILPDSLTTKNTIKPINFLWGGAHDPLPAPLWAANVKESCDLFQQSRLRFEDRLRAEKQRLLYVGLTRARDMLVIAGKRAEDLKKAGTTYAQYSWYEQIKAAGLKINPAAESADTGIITLHAAQKGAVQIQSPPPTETKTTQRPAWVDQKVTAESLVIKRLRPSQMGTVPQGLSPEMVLGQNRFLRGQITHKLFQLLPNYAPAQHDIIARRFVGKYNTSLSASVQEDIVREVLNILSDPHFAPVFGAGSQAEVPISGHVSRDVVISGQIDRLVILPDRVMVVDFKTNRPSPASVDAVPEGYRAQLQAYVTLLQRIYPDRPVDAALLWTDVPRLMWVIKAVNG